jgi:hypothetical protein
MANIFDGIFSGTSGGNSAALAHYNQRLKDYAEDREAFQQAGAVSAIDPYIKEVMSGMTPERQAHLKLQRAMMQNPALFDKGSEGFNTSIKQRGTTIADILKQAEALKTANAKHLFKVQNPLGGDDEASKIQVAKSYVGEEEWNRLQNSTDPADRDKLRSLMRDAWRDRQFVDTGTGYQNVYDTQFISKNLIQAGISKHQAPIISQRLVDFYDDVDQTENFLVQLDNRRADIRRLYGDTDHTSTGFGAVLSLIPLTQAHEWMKLRDTVVSNIGLGKILELKASSAQGATGLGALNEKELKMLQDHLANLSQTNSPEIIREKLIEIDRDMDLIVKQRMRKMRQHRAWYNRNKRYMGVDPKEKDLIHPSQEYLFSGSGYVKPQGETGISDENDLQGIKDKWGLE